LLEHAAVETRVGNVSGNAANTFQLRALTSAGLAGVTWRSGAESMSIAGARRDNAVLHNNVPTSVRPSAPRRAASSDTHFP